MNILYGISSLNQKEVNDSFNRMKEAMHVFEKSHTGVYQDKITHVGNQTNVNYPVNLDHLVYTEKSCHIISNARIDNREELFEILGLEVNEAIPDNTLLLKMYLLLGDDFVKKIEGDWTLVVWNEEKQELLIAKDQYGSSGIYYQITDHYIAFSSTLSALLEIDKNNIKINLEYLAGIMTVWGGNNNETAFENIFFLPPAHYITIKNSQFQLIRYWLAEDTPELHLDSASAYVRSFSEKLEQAVQNRIRYSNKLATQLSSGFDSSTVTTVASEIVKKEGKSLTAYTSIPNFNTSEFFPEHIATDESYLTLPTAAFLGNVNNVLIRCEKNSIINELKEALAIHHAPLHAAGNMYWIHEIYRVAKQQGIDTMLIGQTGNATISWTGYPRGLPYIKSIIKKIISYRGTDKLTIKSYVNHIAKRIADWINPSGQHAWADYAFISTQFAKDIDLERKMKETGHDPTFNQTINGKKGRIAFINPQFSHIGLIWQNLSMHYNINTYDPTNDRRLLEFCISVPNQYFYRENTPKWLLKTAMKGRLIDSLIHQKKKGRQATDISIRIANETEEIGHLISTFKKSPNISYYLNIEKMEECLFKISQNPKSKQAYSDSIYLARAISCALFIEKFSA